MTTSISTLQKIPPFIYLCNSAPYWGRRISRRHTSASRRTETGTQEKLSGENLNRSLGYFSFQL